MTKKTRKSNIYYNIKINRFINRNTGKFVKTPYKHKVTDGYVIYKNGKIKPIHKKYLTDLPKGKRKPEPIPIGLQGHFLSKKYSYNFKIKARYDKKARKPIKNFHFVYKTDKKYVYPNKKLYNEAIDKFLDQQGKNNISIIDIKLINRRDRVDL